MNANEMIELSIKSSLDGSMEPCLFDCPANAAGAPLLVGLHTWSFDRFNQVKAMLPLCRERGWALLLPEFRGPNTIGNPRARQACAARLARQDVLDAVDRVCADYPLDPGKIMVLGGSGGGHMALMMVAYAPQRWRAVSAWVPITDLAAWLWEKPADSAYGKGIQACCGGAPGDSPAVDAEYRDRSPLTHVQALREVNLSVHHGRFDRSVPYTHTLRLALELEKLQAPRFFFEIFDGAHELRYDTAFRWLEKTLAAPAGQPSEKLTR